MRQVVLDTETTGISPQAGHRIIEIGCIELHNRRCTQRHFHCYLQPDRPIDAGAMRVHGITDAFLADKPRFEEIQAELMDFLADAELIIHNAPFDLGFLNHELRRLDPQAQDLSMSMGVIDTLLLAREKHPGQKNNLDALCRRYKIDNSQREYHGALLDAELLADVYLAMTGGQEALNWEKPVDKGRDGRVQGHWARPNDLIMTRLQASEDEKLRERQWMAEIADRVS